MLVRSSSEFGCLLNAMCPISQRLKQKPNWKGASTWPMVNIPWPTVWRWSCFLCRWRWLSSEALCFDSERRSWAGIASFLLQEDHKSGNSRLESSVAHREYQFGFKVGTSQRIPFLSISFSAMIFSKVSPFLDKFTFLELTSSALNWFKKIPGWGDNSKMRENIQWFRLYYCDRFNWTRLKGHIQDGLGPWQRDAKQLDQLHRRLAKQILHQNKKTTNHTLRQASRFDSFSFIPTLTVTIEKLLSLLT